ncbi:hypothetical protein Cni_G15004 [Canna indica]|uniref:Uncharacterized protein n=1 Tax=Canna indica TaxID=4628 RepID=A0AAQ3KH96_9LILI|nr:hypothetical protein Cni_G15004 [Canna indica]
MPNRGLHLPISSRRSPEESLRSGRSATDTSRRRRHHSHDRPPRLRIRSRLQRVRRRVLAEPHRQQRELAEVRRLRGRSPQPSGLLGRAIAAGIRGRGTEEPHRFSRRRQPRLHGRPPSPRSRAKGGIFRSAAGGCVHHLQDIKFVGDEKVDRRARGRAAARGDARREVERREGSRGAGRRGLDELSAEQEGAQEGREGHGQLGALARSNSSEHCQEVCSLLSLVSVFEQEVQEADGLLRRRWVPEEALGDGNGRCEEAAREIGEGQVKEFVHQKIE